MQPALLALALYARCAHRLLLVERDAASLVQALLELLCDAVVLPGNMVKPRVRVRMRVSFGERLQKRDVGSCSCTEALQCITRSTSAQNE